MNPQTKKSIQAYTANEAKQSLCLQSHNIEVLSDQEVLIEISHCGVCRSDAHFINNDWGDSQFPLVPGHEIVGVIKECGRNVENFKPGQRAAVSWQQGACMECEYCLKDQEEFCEKLTAVCLNCRGGFADYCVVDSRFVYTLPDKLKSEYAAPLMCAGATVFHAMTVYDLKPAMKVAIVGIGGLGHLAIQFAKAMGCEVTALTSHPEKRDEALKFGADHVASSVDSEALKALDRSFDFILSTADAILDYMSLINALRPKGRLCFVGMPPEDIQINLFPLVIGQRSICASPCGNRKTIQAMLEFASEHDIRPQIQLMSMTKVNEALKLTEQGKARYRIVLAT